ncbi:MAG TPA: chromate efflux transporter [Aggregatilineaceae bacterium]|nr:chromate efflux transporter [Aggregatilineaceae bacterium]
MPDNHTLTATSLPRRARLRRTAEVAAAFLRIGATAFGGPAAHIAIMRHELVERRKWLDEQHFLDLLGATNLIPGPNSSEMAMHVGFVRAGFAGLIAGGLGFLLPAMVIVLGLAWAYLKYGETPAAGWLLYGIKPVIIPLIVLAIWSLGKRAVKDALTALVGVAALVLYFAGINFVVLLLGGGLVVMLAHNAARLRKGHLVRAILPLPLIGPVLATSTVTATGFSLWEMFLIFLKIGALLYGSGYVLFAYMQADLVTRHAWLTQRQLIDAIAVGQMTPGPLSTSTTFVGYLLGGVPGALIATGAFYLPSFIVVAISNPLIPRLRRSAWAGSFLDGVNVAALGIMTAVTWQLARAAFPDAFTLLVGLAAAGLLLRYRLNSVWLVAFGAALGLLHAVL